MTRAQDFLRALQAASHADGQSVDGFWKRQKDEWIADLTDLRQSMLTWLSPMIEAKFATSKNLDFTLEEPDTGRYTAPGLEIELLTTNPRALVGLVETGGARLTDVTLR